MSPLNFHMLIFIVIVIVSTASRGSATQHTVGDTSGWIIPSDHDFYTEWASKQIFVIGDSLYFDFKTGTHDVAVVSKEGYDQCHADDGSVIIPTGPATINLTEVGDHYYICRFEGHCLFSQKLAINVSPAFTAAPRRPL